MSKRRERWRPVLEAEVKRWSSRSSAELLAELADEQVYEVEFEGRKHQVEVQILENTESYIRVVVSVDDGSLPASLSPLLESFIRQKDRK
jgi:tRNA U54 and U55 pseudouridine synthase Pus10